MSRLVAVTGATGFVGSHLLPELAAAGWRIRVLARSMPPTGALGETPVEVVPFDLTRAEDMPAALAGADAVVHLAGAIKARDRETFMRINADGTEAVARAWQRACPDAAFICVSSMAARMPGLSPYAASKGAAEERLQAVAGQGRHAILRAPAVYGPGDRETLAIFRLAALPIQPLLGGPEARLCLIHARDLARAITALLETPLAGEIWEVSDARTGGYGWRELTAEAATALGRRPAAFRLPAPLLRAVGRFGDLGGRLRGKAEMLTSAKVRELLHPDWSSSPERQPPRAVFAPEIGIAEGFRETIQWYREKNWL